MDEIVSDVGWETAVNVTIFNEKISSEEELLWYGIEPGTKTILHQRRLVYADIIHL